MASLRGCPFCSGWMLWEQYACNECNGTNTRESIKQRTKNLGECLRVAAVEELRVRAACSRMRDEWSMHAVSEMFATTGKQRVEPCAKCGREVTQQESVGLYRGTVVWTTERHQAPCGLFCWGAGVPPKEYRLHQIHGHESYPCPACNIAEKGEG